MSRFINERKNNWQQLEGLLDILESSPIRGLPRAQVREFGELYRRAAADLAIARAESRDPKLVNYLNSLVIRAHGKIYRAESQGFNLLVEFFGRDLPRVFRQTLNYTLVAFALFAIFAVASGWLAYADGNFGDVLGLSRIQTAAQNNFKWWESLNEANQVGAGEILTNNIMVSVRAFAYGAFFGIGTIWILIYNGIQIGGTVGVCFRANPEFARDLLTFMVGHGVIELSCIFIAGGAGLLIGHAMIAPGDLGRFDALKNACLQAVRLAVGCAVLLVVAGIIEGFLSPSALPAIVKIGTGVLTGIAMYAYLFLVGRDGDAATQTPNETLKND